MIKRISESKSLTKFIPWECKWKLDETKCKQNQWWNNNKCQFECKKYHYVKKIVYNVIVKVILLAFLLIAIGLMIAAAICCCLIKCPAKYFLPFYRKIKTI